MSGQLKDLENGVEAKDAELQQTSSDSTKLGHVDSLRETARVVDHKAERALCFKFDCRLLPVLAFMCQSSERPGKEKWMLMVVQTCAMLWTRVTWEMPKLMG